MQSVHVAEASVAVKVLAAQVVHVALEVAPRESEEVEGGQAVQVAAFAGEYVPDAQARQSNMLS